jgi:hypothetical protein
VRSQTQMNTNIALNSGVNKVLVEKKKKSLVRVDKKKILLYSAIKIKAKPPDPYSTLNPDTSSDSPSAKSKGVRLVSATQEISHRPTIGVNNIVFIMYLADIMITYSLMLEDATRMNNKIKANLIS